jgi:chemotaxis protein CheX
MTAPFVLPARLDLSAAAPLRDALVGRRGGDLELDAGAVAHLGGLCVQLLLAAAVSWRAAGHSLTLASRSQAFDEALSLFGLSADDLQAGQFACR